MKFQYIIVNIEGDTLFSLYENYYILSYLN